MPRTRARAIMGGQYCEATARETPPTDPSTGWWAWSLVHRWSRATAMGKLDVRMRKGFSIGCPLAGSATPRAHPSKSTAKTSSRR
eukprot:15450516-Alexandrium_andersonii.AAC.1